MQPHKTCTKCGAVKPLDDYYRGNGYRDGRRPECKNCKNSYAAQYRDTNRDKERDRSRKYRAENPDYGREYYAKNRDKERARRREYYAKNRQLVSAVSAEKQAQLNAATAQLAHRNGEPWQDWEDVLVMAENGQTDYQKAITLHRTYRAVKQRRHLLTQKEPANA